MSPRPNWTSQGSASQSAPSVLLLVASTTLRVLLGSLTLIPCALIGHRLPLRPKTSIPDELASCSAPYPSLEITGQLSRVEPHF